mgnify:CR=1 FL=1
MVYLSVLLQFFHHRIIHTYAQPHIEILSEMCENIKDWAAYGKRRGWALKWLRKHKSTYNFLEKG